MRRRAGTLYSTHVHTTAAAAYWTVCLLFVVSLSVCGSSIHEHMTQMQMTEWITFRLLRRSRRSRGSSAPPPSPASSAAPRRCNRHQLKAIDFSQWITQLPVVTIWNSRPTIMPSYPGSLIALLRLLSLFDLIKFFFISPSVARGS